MLTAKESAARLVEHWPAAKTTPTQMDSYERVFNDVEEDARERLIRRLVDDHDWLPSVFMVRQAWKTMQPPPPPEEELEFQKFSMPEWAEGCYQCNYGIVAAPPIKTDTLAMERLQQARNGDVEFCTCDAGKAQRSYLLKLHRKAEIWQREEVLAVNGEAKKRG